MSQDKKEREFVPSDRQITITGGEGCVYLKPIGGDRPSVYVSLRVADGVLIFMQDPFAPLTSPIDLFEREFDLSEIAAAMEECADSNERPLFKRGSKGAATITIFRIDSVDLEAPSVTITLDKEVEVYDPAALETP